MSFQVKCDTCETTVDCPTVQPRPPHIPREPDGWQVKIYANGTIETLCPDCKDEPE